MSNLKSQFATSSSAASYIPKLEIPNRDTKFYVRLLFAFTVYHTFFYEDSDSHNLGISAEKEDKTIRLSELLIGHCCEFKFIRKMRNAENLEKSMFSAMFSASLRGFEPPAYRLGERIGSVNSEQELSL